jgi:hypothetical protein
MYFITDDDTECKIPVVDAETGEKRKMYIEEAYELGALGIYQTKKGKLKACKPCKTNLDLAYCINPKMLEPGQFIDLPDKYDLYCLGKKKTKKESLRVLPTDLNFKERPYYENVIYLPIKPMDDWHCEMGDLGNPNQKPVPTQLYQFRLGKQGYCLTDMIVIALTYVWANQVPFNHLFLINQKKDTTVGYKIELAPNFNQVYTSRRRYCRTEYYDSIEKRIVLK